MSKSVKNIKLGGNVGRKVPYFSGTVVATAVLVGAVSCIIFNADKANAQTGTDSEVRGTTASSQGYYSSSESERDSTYSIESSIATDIKTETTSSSFADSVAESSEEDSYEVADTVPVEEDGGTEKYETYTYEPEIETYTYETECSVPNYDSNCFSEWFYYMGYQTVTDTASNQYALLNGNDAWTSPEGMRMNGDRYCIALGSYYSTDIGQKVDVTLADGTVIKCILGDCKADCHTDVNNQYGLGIGNVVEFIVDNSVYPYVCDNSGRVNWVFDKANENAEKVVSIALVD